MADLYALVENYQAVLYPLTIDDINTRNNPNEQYSRCVFGNKPPLANNVEYYVDLTQVVDGVVLINYDIKTKTFDMLFSELAALNPGNPVSISLVPLTLLSCFEILTKIAAQAELDTFAQSRGYDNIHSVTTYVNSTIPQYQTEANRGIYLRDQTWQSLYIYLEGIKAGTIPLPTSWADIQANLPNLTWV